MGCMPEVPPDAKQTNCWKFAFIFYTVVVVLNIITAVINELWSSLPGAIVEYLLWIIVMYHVAYVHISVNEQRIDITMGPWQWPVFRWCCSSQIQKEEIVLIERKQRQCLYDVCPRLYCFPIYWCCCHKSYSAYWWPCCCNDINCLSLCDGDSDSSDMIQISLTTDPQEFTTMCFKRCAPCPLPWSICVCCVYNRVAVSIKNEEVWQSIQSCGYPLALNDSNERTGLAQSSAPITTNEGNTPV